MGVIIDLSGLVLINYYVIVGVGVFGFGGFVDGELYFWKFIGIDLGGDVVII